MNEQLTEIINTFAQKLGVASQFVITELSKWKIANHLVWLVIGSVILFIAYKVFMIGVNKCKEYNKKVDEDYNKRIEYVKQRNGDIDRVYKPDYDDMFQDNKYFVYWLVPLFMCIVSIPMVIYGIFVIPWLIAPTGSMINYLLDILK